MTCQLQFDTARLARIHTSSTLRTLCHCRMLSSPPACGARKPSCSCISPRPALASFLDLQCIVFICVYPLPSAVLGPRAPTMPVL